MHIVRDKEEKELCARYIEKRIGYAYQKMMRNKKIKQIIDNLTNNHNEKE